MNNMEKPGHNRLVALGVKLWRDHRRLVKFFVAGGSAALVNLLLITVFIELLGFRSYFLKNLANILAIEMSVVYIFTLSRFWTWRDAPKKQGKSLVGQFLSFNLAYLAGTAIKVILFALFENWGMFYIFNVAIGMVAAAAFDYILCDRLVFKRNQNRDY
jgi:putative flippase GtrA